MYGLKQVFFSEQFIVVNVKTEKPGYITVSSALSWVYEELQDEACFCCIHTIQQSVIFLQLDLSAVKQSEV